MASERRETKVAVRDRGVDYGIARAMDALDTVARDTLHNVCRSLGFRSTELDALLDESPLPSEEKGASTLTVFAYDAARDALPSLTEFAAEPHVDRTILTLVVSNERDGLRVRRADDSWRTASLGRNRIAVIPGRTLEHALGGAIKATTHAVSRLRVPRNTLVFRLAARPEAVVSPATPRDIAARYPTQTAKELEEAFERTHRSVNRPPEPANPARRAARESRYREEINLKVRAVRDKYELTSRRRSIASSRVFQRVLPSQGLNRDEFAFLRQRTNRPPDPGGIGHGGRRLHRRHKGAGRRLTPRFSAEVERKRERRGKRLRDGKPRETDDKPREYLCTGTL